MARIPLVTEFEGKGVDRAIKEFKRLETTGQKAGFALKKAFVPATAALAGLTAAAGLSLKAATEEARAQSELERQIIASTDATIAQTEATLEFIRAQELASGIASNELRPALAILVRHTGDLSKAQELLALAMDVSVGTGRDVFDVAERMAEGFTGVLTPLEELDYGLVQSIENGASFNDIMNSLADTFGGAVAKDAETAAGRFERMGVQINQAKIAIGMALLPVLERLVPVLERVAQFVGENTDLIITLAAVVGTVATAIVALNGAMKVLQILEGIQIVLLKVLQKEFTLLWIATGVGIILAIIAVLVTLQMKFNILGKAVDAVKWAFEQAWGALKDLINGAIDGINDLIWLINKIPGVDIPEIGKIGDEAEKATEPMGRFETSIRNLNKQVDIGREPMGRFEKSIRNVENEGDQLATTLGRVNVELDPLNEGIETATQRLDDFFDALDQQKAADEFIEDLRDIEQRLKGIQEGTDEWQAAQNEAYEALRDLRREREDLSDAFFEVLKLEIDTGDLERAYTLMANLVDLGGVINVPATFADLNFPELGLTSGAMFGGQNFGGGFSNQVVNNYFPEGIDIDEVIRRLQGEQRQNGAIPVNFDQNVMW